MVKKKEPENRRDDVGRDEERDRRDQGGRQEEHGRPGQDRNGEETGRKPRNPVEEADQQQEKKRRQLEEIMREQARRSGKDDQREDEGERPTASPWLLIPYSFTDLGARPIPSGEAHWRSPYIWIESSDPDGNGVAGEENFVHVRIFNLGMAPAVPVQVDFYWADPSLGLGPANMNLIGTEWVAVGSIASLDVRCNTPWIPTFVNNGHECLMVNCSNHILDPILHPFQPRVDRHVGQVNVTVLQGSAMATLQFALGILNVFNFTTLTEIHATVNRFEMAEEAIEEVGFRELANRALGYRDWASNTPAELLARYRAGTGAYRDARRIAGVAARRQTAAGPPSLISPVLRGAAPRVHGALSESLGQITPLEGAGRRLAQELLAQDALDPNMTCGAPLGADLLDAIQMKPFGAARLHLELTVPADAREGEFFVFNIEQRANGLLVGGYSILIRVTETGEEIRT